MKVQKIALTAILASTICLFSPFSFPAGAIPISLASLAIYLVACIADIKSSVTAVIIYILLGAAGLPVFSGFTGGFHRLAGITGGYIIGYIPCVLIIGLLIRYFENRKFIYPLSMISGTVVCYLTGTIWYMLQTNSKFIHSLMICVVPFIAGDIIKIAVASCIGITLRKRLSKFLY